MQPSEKLAQILRTDKEKIEEFANKLGAMTKKDGVAILDKIVKENKEKIKSKMYDLGLNKFSSAEEVYEALLAKVKAIDATLFKIFEEPDFSTTEGCGMVIDSAKNLSGNLTGMFLKKEKASALLRKNPPKSILETLGYKNIDTLLEKEDIMEVFSALRFVEDPRWLNDVFFREYQTITKEDFEERPIEARVLGKEWLERGQKYAGKKLHHISHLKELGLIFVIPYETTYPGATLEGFSLMIHYFHEVDFYSRLFAKYSKEPNFNHKIILALKGEVGGKPLPNREMISIRIIQRYLAKDDPNDPRLFEPHVNPEVIHWFKAEKDMARLSEKYPELDLEFFQDVDFVGDFFNSKKLKKDVFISFDLVDNIISLTRLSDIESRYLYHQHEALWNKIFVEFLGLEEVENLLINNLDSGHLIFSTKTI